MRPVWERFGLEAEVWRRGMGCRAIRSQAYPMMSMSLWWSLSWPPSQEAEKDWPQAWRGLFLCLQGCFRCKCCCFSFSNWAQCPGSATEAMIYMAEQTAVPWSIHNALASEKSRTVEPVCSPLSWLTCRAKWVTSTNVKRKGEVFHVEGAVIRNDIKSLFLNIEALFALSCDSCKWCSYCRKQPDWVWCVLLLDIAVLWVQIESCC